MNGPKTTRRWRVRPFPAALVALSLALAAILASPALGDESGPAPPPVDMADLDVAMLQRVVRVLDRLGTEPSAEDSDRAVKELLEIGAEAAPSLLALGRRFGDRVHIDVTARVLDGLRSGAIDTYLVWMAGNAEEMENRREAYLSLGRYGTAAALPALLATMERDPVELKDKSGAALAGILRRHPEPAGYQALARGMGQVAADTRIRVLDAVAEVGSIDGFRLHAAMLGKEPAIEGAVVSGLARMQHVDDTASILPRLRQLVTSADAFTRRQAVIALGKYEDPASIGILIDLLDAPDRGVRENALWSLRNVSMCRFPADARRWRLWHAEEMAWWEKEGKGYFETLGSGNRAAVLVAIRRLTERPLFRNVVYAALARLAGEGSDEIREAARVALVRLGLEAGEPPAGVLAAATTAIRELPETGTPVEQAPAAAPPAKIGWFRVPLPLLFLGGLVILYLLLRVIGFGAARAQRRADRGPVTIQTRSRAERLASLREGAGPPSDRR